jgi:hypothetical protein
VHLNNITCYKHERVYVTALLNLTYDGVIIIYITTEVVIGTPRDLQHNIHVNKELDWHVRDPETSFKLEEKLGEGYAGTRCVLLTFLMKIQLFWSRVQSHAS